jgi:hypothetical protein
LDKEQARFYRDRWKAVEEIETQERSRLTDEEKLRQLSILFEFARAVQPSRAPDYVVLERWRKLRERLHDSQE